MRFSALMSLTWIMPSTPSESCTNAPNFVRLVTGPSTAEPTANFCVTSVQGSPERLFQAQGNATRARTHPENHGFHGLARLDYIAGCPHLLCPRHLGDVDQALKSGLKFNKRAEIEYARHRTASTLTRLVFCRYRIPRVGLKLFHADRNAAFLGIDFRRTFATSISCPTESTSAGLLTRLLEMSLTCSKASTSPMSTKAP